MAEEAQGTAAEQPAESLHDALARTFSEAESVAETEAPEAQAEETPEEEAAPQGETAEEEGAQPEEPPEGEEQEEAAADEAQPLEAPEHWSAEDREHFATIDRAGQEFLLRRHREMEGDYTRKAQEIAEIRRALDTYRPMLQQLGVSDGHTVQQLLSAQYALATQPQAAVARIAQAYLGENWLARFTDDASETADDDLSDPRVARVLSEVETLKRHLVQQQQTTQQQQQEAARQAIDAFSSAADDQGRPLHPHFAAVEDYMGRLIASGAAATLEEAYDRAIWATPDVRRKLLEEAGSKSSAEKKSAAKRAKAKVLPRGKSAGEDNTPKERSLRDELRAAIDGSA